ncbi:MAG: ferredoxin [Ramlibacter sp.]|nr:ferredoxin [Ramlibacter sp.]
MNSMAETVALCDAGDIAEGEMRAEFLPDGTVIALYKVEGEIYATDDACTHGAASLSEDGTLRGKVVECSWHNGCFDVTTGEPCASPCSVALKTYPVTVVDGVVNVAYGGT